MLDLRLLLPKLSLQPFQIIILLQKKAFDMASKLSLFEL
jgi:hypothetical protein